MVAGLVHFGEATGSMLIAEGVERSEEAAALRDLRVPLAQGFLYGRPAPVAA
jgi:EAL domain-containing protein (putative c-di-GMP-specific phosphodiesterase class I)